MYQVQGPHMDHRARFSSSFIGTSFSAFLTIFKIFIYLFIWLCQVLVEAFGIFSCVLWDPIPRPGTESRPPALGAQSLSHWTTRQVPPLSVSYILNIIDKTVPIFLLFAMKQNFLKH